jgi:primosomal protein N' (replication factor Y)
LKYVEVAVNLAPIRGTFDYHLPPELQDQVSPGHLVTIPFGRRRLQGVIINLPASPAVPETRAVESLVDPLPVLTAAQLELAHWLQQATLAPLIDCLTLMLPPGLSQPGDSEYSLLDPAAHGRSATQERLIEVLRRRGPLRGRQLGRSLERLSWRPAAEALVQAGILSRRAVLDAPRVHPRRVRTARISAPPEQLLARYDAQVKRPSAASARRRDILRLLLAEEEALEVSWICAETGAQPTDLRRLESLGLLALSEAEVWRDPLESLEFVPSQPPPLTPEQQAAWEPIEKALSGDSRRAACFLLHGVTGSGKTEIYLRAIEAALRQGHQAIFLVPEIALTPQTLRRVAARFPGQVGVLHSQLSDGERYDTWRRCRRGELSVLVGPRSALFAPLPSIGLIVLDESHDESYKEQSLPPRYHARSAAQAYAAILGAVCVMGSATPDLVTRYQAEQGSIERLVLPSRILGHQERLQGQAKRLNVALHFRPGFGQTMTAELPPVRLVDMRQELKAGNRSLFSRALQQALRQTLDDGQQAILFINRRGTSTYVFCRECGSVLRCPRCQAPLTYHAHEAQLLCHRCNYRRRMPEHCPACGSHAIRQFGAGTERIQSELGGLFPGATALRWDWDTTRRKGAHEVILAHFAAHRADVLVGTQMIAKGLDLPLVTLVGVISADTGLNLPDYRASERTYQLLTQVIGRAGRSLLGGRAIIQTYQPDHPAIRSAAAYNDLAFYRQELAQRKALGYPPFQRLARLLTRSPQAATAQRRAERMAAIIRHLIDERSPNAELVGPVPCFFERIRGEYRWQLVVRADDPRPLIPQPLQESWQLDIDPVSLL